MTTTKKAKANGTKPASPKAKRISPDAKIKIVKKDASFAAGSNREKRFKALRDGMTVEQFLAKTGSKPGNVRFFVEQGIIALQ